MWVLRRRIEHIEFVGRDTVYSGRRTFSANVSEGFATLLFRMELLKALNGDKTLVATTTRWFKSFSAKVSEGFANFISRMELLKALNGDKTLVATTTRWFKSFSAKV